MPSESEESIATLLASAGDYENKIAVLQKIIASTTKEKQNLEIQNNQLQQDLSDTGKKLSSTQEENNKLRTQLSNVQGELEQERRRNSGLGQHAVKDLSSFVPNSEEASGAAVSLSNADAERLSADNQSLRKNVDTLNLKNHTKEEALDDKREREMEELRTMLHTVTTKCDELYAQRDRESACINFCRHYVTLSINKRLFCEDAPFTVLLSRNKGNLTSAAKADVDDVQKSLLDTCSFWRTLLGGVSVLLISLRDGLPLNCRGTKGDLRCLTDRLSTLLEAHQSEKDNLLFIISHIEEAAGKEMSPALLMQVQDEGLQALVKWIALMRSHVALLVESAVAYLPHGEVFHLTDTAARGGKVEVANRDEFVDAVTVRGSDLLSTLAGSLDALAALLNTTADLPFAEGGAAGVETPDAASRWLLALQYFLWEGTSQCSRMRSSAHTLADGCDDIAAACNHSQMRDSLTCISKALRELASPSTVVYEENGNSTSSSSQTRRQDNGHDVQAREQLPLSSSNNRYHYEDLLTALASADQTAVCLNAHNNALLVELAAAKDYQRKLEAELHVARTSLHTKEAESQQAQLVLQDQPRALSQQMVTHR